MLGWGIFVKRQRMPGQDGEPVLAKWECGVGGCEWVDKLVAANKAEGRIGAGYPNRYLVAARHLIALLANGAPAHQSPPIIGDDYVMSANWTGKVIIDKEALAACPPDEILMVEAWDLS